VADRPTAKKQAKPPTPAPDAVKEQRPLDPRRVYLDALVHQLQSHAGVIRHYLGQQNQNYTLGLAAETGVRDVLRQVLPGRFGVTSGFNVRGRRQPGAACGKGPSDHLRSGSRSSRNGCRSPSRETPGSEEQLEREQRPAASMSTSAISAPPAAARSWKQRETPAARKSAARSGFEVPFGRPEQDDIHCERPEHGRHDPLSAAPS
jgi:hypothetical protein